MPGPRRQPEQPGLRRGLLALAAGSLLLPGLGLGGPALALDSPKGRVILTISGSGLKTNQDGRVALDMDMLAALPQRSIKVNTPWYPEARKFTGPLLRDVLALAGARGSSIEAYALNDYRVSIPMEDVLQHSVILARLMDDQPMPVRDKGPLFIIYPFDEDRRLRTSIYYSRCAWQLKALEIR
ncbi:molybdopterin-dependent oxidoreductase [Mitsuaria sp. WAJ17]|uniref:molybdopterin-dependent oxidoreductase n=1 Tax=Mitsuaria sp. WAJ17 TaxID=2761452 RepID=UPI001601FF1A|nr:molybdopterin-dependent oxidoreductase [Mitsuaria sp. WAJ17]MBB2486860.1 molybdopterin-dependent oxidoreductase [Mitsuaria sp. WAJ17]